MVILALLSNRDIAFNIKRIYYLYDGEETRGGHAHRNSFDVMLDDG